jgi:hypothetical protein
MGVILMCAANMRYITALEVNDDSMDGLR